MSSREPEFLTLLFQLSGPIYVTLIWAINHCRQPRERLQRFAEHLLQNPLFYGVEPIIERQLRHNRQVKIWSNYHLENNFYKLRLLIIRPMQENLPDSVLLSWKLAAEPERGTAYLEWNECTEPSFASPYPYPYRFKGEREIPLVEDIFQIHVHWFLMDDKPSSFFDFVYSFLSDFEKGIEPPEEFPPWRNRPDLLDFFG